ncbi:MAG: hypothetical protein U0470_08020 [Anaerolineae bacterium]
MPRRGDRPATGLAAGQPQARRRRLLQLERLYLDPAAAAAAAAAPGDDARQALGALACSGSTRPVAGRGVLFTGRTAAAPDRSRRCTQRGRAQGGCRGRLRAGRTSSTATVRVPWPLAIAPPPPAARRR